MQNTTIWNLKEIITEIISKHTDIEEIYLFGSRAYKTGSIRSDIDLLAITKNPIPFPEINEWLPFDFPSVDLFISYDKTMAMSAANGSYIKKRAEESLVEQLDAVTLWKKEKGFNEEFTDWEQKSLANVKFEMSILPYYSINDSIQSIEELILKLENDGIKTFYAGSTWRDIALSIIKIVEKALTKPLKYSHQARQFSFDIIKLKTEYDFQNFIHLLLRPLFPTIEPENIAITIDGNDKFADFGIAKNKIIIEAKHIKDTSSKSAVIKTLEGLKDFYSANSNVKCLIFFVLYEPSVALDENILNGQFDGSSEEIPFFVRFIKNEFN